MSLELLKSTVVLGPVSIPGVSLIGHCRGPRLKGSLGHPGWRSTPRGPQGLRLGAARWCVIEMDRDEEEEEEEEEVQVQESGGGRRLSGPSAHRHAGRG